MIHYFNVIITFKAPLDGFDIFSKSVYTENALEALNEVSAHLENLNNLYDFKNITSVTITKLW